MFTRPQAQMTGGVERVEVEAERVGELIAALYERFPGLRGELDDMAVSIDDELHADALYLRLERDDEVVFVPRIAGG